MKSYVLLAIGIGLLVGSLIGWLGDFARKTKLETKAQEYTWMFEEK